MNTKRKVLTYVIAKSDMDDQDKLKEAINTMLYQVEDGYKVINVSFEYVDNNHVVQIITEKNGGF